MGFSWYNGSWTKVKKITIPSAKLGGSGSLSDVRALISVTDADVQAAAQADGDDILFADHTGELKLDHALKSYDGGTGEILAWVRIPTIADASVDYSFYFYYGNGGCAAQENPDGVGKDAPTYPAVAIYNFDGDVVDSSGNSYDATNFGSSDVAGKVGNCRSFDGTNDYLTAPHADFTTIEQDNTVSMFALVKLNVTGIRQQIIAKGNTGSETLSLYVSPLGKVVFEDYYAGTYEYNATGLTNICDNTWHRIVGVRDGATFKVYVDGVDDTATTSGGVDTHSTTEDVYIGKRLNNDYLVDGDIDELWIINGSVSANEALADYNTIDDPSTFMSYSAEMTFVEALREMNHFPLEEIVEDLEMPWWHDLLRADRSMQVTILESLYNDEEMPVSLWQGPDVIATREMVLTLLEEIEVDKDLPTTILEWIRQELEPRIPLLEGIYKDLSTIFHPSQDRADDREMPITILEKILNDNNVPFPLLENIIVDSELPLPIIRNISSDEAMVFLQIKKLYNDLNMPIGPSEIIMAVVADREMPFCVLQGVNADSDLIITLLENLYTDREINFYLINNTVSDETIGTTLLEHISVTHDPSVFVIAPTRNDGNIPVHLFKYLYADKTTPVTLSERILYDIETLVHQTEGIHNDEEMPITLLDVVLRDIGMNATLREHVLDDIEMPVFINKEYAPVPITPADRLMPVYIMASVVEDKDLLTILREFIVADGNMPIEWWDEVKHKIPTGIYELLNQTWQYRLEVLDETIVNQRSETKLVGKS